VICLHACDTATDAAIAKAIGWNARVILAVPCCQKELIKKISVSGLEPLLRHGFLRERFGSMATDTLRALGSATWATHVLSTHPDKAGHGSVNVPVVCDGVRVEPGDLVVADGDGVIVVPRRHAATVVEGAEARMRKEDAMMPAIAAGAAVWELSGAAASYARLAVQEIDAAFDDPPPG
jgi:hypothetical protein